MPFRTSSPTNGCYHFSFPSAKVRIFSFYVSFSSSIFCNSLFLRNLLSPKSYTVRHYRQALPTATSPCRICGIFRKIFSSHFATTSPHAPMSRFSINAKSAQLIELHAFAYYFVYLSIGII